MRVSTLAIGLALLGHLLAIRSASATCVDYGAYIHWVGSVATPGEAMSVAVSGTIAYVADGYSGLQAIDIATSEHPKIVGSASTLNYASGVAVQGAYAYVTASRWLQVFDVSDPEHMHPLGELSFPQEVGSIVVEGEHAYISGSTLFYVVDVSTLMLPRVVGSLAMSCRGITLSGSYAYITDWNGLNVIDITDPTNPRLVGGVIVQGGTGGIDVSGAFCVTTTGSGLCVIDITDPQHPGLLGGVALPVRASGVAISGDHALTVGGRYGSGALQTIDITVPSSPRLVGTVDTQEVHGIAIAGNHAYVSAESETSQNFEGLEVIDISNCESPGTVGSVPLSGSFAVSGNIACAMELSSGVQVIDISDPQHPQIVGSVDTPGSAVSGAIDGKHLYVADMTSGVEVIDIANPRNPRVVANIGTPTSICVAVSGTHVYVTDYMPGLHVIDIADPENPRIVGSIALPDSPVNVAVSGAYAYVVCTYAHPNGIRVIDISIPEAPRLVGSFARDDLIPWAVAVSGTRAYLADAGLGLVVIDVTDPTNPWMAGNIPFGAATGVAVSDGTAYVSTDRLGLQIIDAWNPGDLRIVGNVSGAGGATVSDGYLYVGASGPAFTILPIECENTAGVIRGNTSSKSTLRLRAFPNPAVGRAVLCLELPTAGCVRTNIHDVTGRLVRSLQDGIMSVGVHDVSWDGRDSAGRKVAAGSYLARVVTSEGTMSARVVILK